MRSKPSRWEEPRNENLGAADTVVSASDATLQIDGFHLTRRAGFFSFFGFWPIDASRTLNARAFRDMSQDRSRVNDLGRRTAVPKERPMANRKVCVLALLSPKFLSLGQNHQRQIYPMVHNSL